MDDPRNRLAELFNLARTRLHTLKVPGADAKAPLPPIHIVPHTHWDREWYQTFAGYRSRLVPLVEGLMDLLEKYPDFKSFTFDGQVAPIDDYLATLTDADRPATDARLRRLISAGRIQIGPWYTAQDFHLVSGETTIRNIELGMARAKEYGFCVDVAYCPDQFGLIPELPKILRRAGITKVIGERGMKRELPWLFRWQAADGSEVDVYNIKDHYGGSGMSAQDIRSAARSRGFTTLILSGDDHTVPSADLIARAAKAGASMSSLGEFWKELPSFAATPLHRGEIRAAGNHNLLPNVISNRVDQRIETARSERLLERYAEPLALFAAQRYPQGLLDRAWHNLILNAAHDSACATGIDEVTREVRVRARETYDTAEGIVGDCTRTLGQRMQHRGRYVWNPSNFARDVRVPGGNGRELVAHDVPPLGWALLVDEPAAVPLPHTPTPPIRFVDEGDIGDTYTFEPGPTAPHDISLPLHVEQRSDEPFQRLTVRWENRDRDHRVRIHIKLPDVADHSVTDTQFGAVTRPAVPGLEMSNDRLNGYPASKFIIAGGVAVLVDRTAEYELLPDTNELAITLVRSHGKLSYGGGVNRRGGAGPQLDTHETQMLGDVEWQLAVMPWTASPDAELPWRAWEQFMLPMRRFEAPGGGHLPAQGTYFSTPPSGVLSAVLPGTVRSFEPTGAHRLIEKPLTLREPQRDIGNGVA